MRWMFVLVVAACAGRPLRADEWRTQVPDAACVATIHEKAFEEPYEHIVKYDAAGHVVYGETRLRYDARGTEYVTWKDGRVVRVDSYDEQDAEDFPCDMVGGCYQPARRTIDHTYYRYDGAKLVGVRRASEVFVKRGAQWLLNDDSERENRYDYEGDRLVEASVEVDGTRDATIEYAGGHPVRRDKDRFEWSGDRMTAYHWMGYVQAFEYDERGRLSRELMTLDSAPDWSKTTTWTYDDRGRLVSRVEDERSTKDGPSQTHELTWSYDELGRLLRATEDSITKSYTYGASCAPNLAQPNLPTALARAHLAVCMRSPGYLVDTCE